MKTTIFDLENWREIGTTLARNKTRTLLTAFGIFWGIFMLTALLGGAGGMEDMLRSNFEGFASNSAIIFPNRRTVSYRGFNKGSEWNMTTADVEAIRRIPGIDAVAAISYGGSATVSSGHYSVQTSIQGVDRDFVKAFLPTINEGRFLNSADERSRAKVAIIGLNIANSLFPDGDAIGKFINIFGIHYTVVGVVSQQAEVNINGNKIDNCVTIPLSTFARAFNQGDRVEIAMITACNGFTPTGLKPRIVRAIRANHPIAPNDDNAIMFIDIAERFAMMDMLFLALSILALFVGLGTLIAGIIGVGNIMWVIVKERTGEIGIRRAIGATPADIVTQILSEGIALTLVAGTAGIVFSVGLLAVAQQLTGKHFQIEFYQAVVILLIFLVLGIAASIIPSLKAMKIKPIEAINDK